MGLENHNMYRTAGDILGQRCQEQQKQIKQLESENKKLIVENERIKAVVANMESRSSCRHPLDMY